MSKVVKRGSVKARRKTARLAASQAVYQTFVTDKDARTIVSEFLTHYLNQDVEGEPLITADAETLSKLVQGVEERKDDLKDLIQPHLKNRELENLDGLLQSMLYVGTFELLDNTETDVAILMNDYIDVAKAFYDDKEASLVNAVLDGVAKSIR